MATNLLTAGQVMRQSAALLNDQARSIYPYSVQVPYLNLALQELQELFEQNSVPVTDKQTAELDIPAGVSEITFAPDPPVVDVAYLPDDFIEPEIVWERNFNINPYIQMNRVNYLPLYFEGIETNQFIWYIWASQKIQFLPSNANNQIKINYIRALFNPVTDEDSEINVINAESFLSYRNAGLCAEFIAENKTRADDLNGFASLAMDRALGISTKTRQAITVRRRPFRKGYKSGVNF